MPVAAFKDLCVDALDPRRLGSFWAGALDLEVAEEYDDGIVKLVGATPQHTLWVNPVPEPVVVKQRVHLDVEAATVDDVLALGAAALDLDSFRWKVLRDPEGGELCVFEREEVPSYRLYEVVVDSRDHRAQARWWGDVLGAETGHDEQDRWSWVEAIPGAPFQYLVFGPVPEPKTVKNRIHWDVETGDVPGLVDRGATVLREPDDEIRWTVLADPEGNEFCAFETG